MDVIRNCPGGSYGGEILGTESPVDILKRDDMLAMIFLRCKNLFGEIHIREEWEYKLQLGLYLFACTIS